MGINLGVDKDIKLETTEVELMVRTNNQAMDKVNRAMDNP